MKLTRHGHSVQSQQWPVIVADIHLKELLGMCACMRLVYDSICLRGIRPQQITKKTGVRDVCGPVAQMRTLQSIQLTVPLSLGMSSTMPYTRL